jgi:hypothetical protein
MTKNDLWNDFNFRQRCRLLKLDPDNFELLGNVIVLTSLKENNAVFLDENYNIMGVENHVPSVQLVDAIREEYESVNGRLPIPFQGFSLKQLVELSNRVDILQVKHGDPYDMLVNGQIVIADWRDIYVFLLSYISFLGGQTQKYFINQYQKELQGFEASDVYEFITTLMNKINECVAFFDKAKERMFPRHIIEWLGQDPKIAMEYDYQLDAIIDMLDPKVDLSVMANRLLKILSVSKEEVAARYEKINGTFKIEEIDLYLWLSENSGESKQAIIRK